MFGMAWLSLIWFGMVWFCAVWHGMVWFVTLVFSTENLKQCSKVQYNVV